MSSEQGSRKIVTPTELSSEDARAAEAYLSMIWGALAFATMGALSHFAGAYFSWQIVALARTSLALIFSLIIAISSGVRLVLFRPAGLWMRSVVGSIGVLCAFYAITHLPISTSITLSNTFPVWVTILAWPVLGIRPTLYVWVAVITGIAGVLIIQRPHWAGSQAAVVAALGNAVATAVAMIGLNRLRNVDARAVVTHFSGVSTVICLIFLLMTSRASEWASASGKPAFLLLIGVGLTGTLGQLGMTRAFAIGHPSKVAVVGLTQIIFACLFDLIFWKRRFDLLTLFGMLLIVAPTAWLLLHSPLRKQAAIHTTA